MDHCQECGFVYADVSARDLPVRLRAAGPRFGAALEAVPDPRRRPAPAVWSPLEYTCHVRDVLRVQGERVALALHADHPTFVAMGRDERVVQDGYNSQDLSTVVADLHDAANDLAGVFAGLTASQWSRTGVYNWPAAESRSLLWIGRHTIHELEHHLIDVGRR